MSHSLRLHELQHARPPCPSPTPGVHPNPIQPSRPLSSPSPPALSLSQHQGLSKCTTHGETQTQEELQKRAPSPGRVCGPGAEQGPSLLAPSPQEHRPASLQPRPVSAAPALGAARSPGWDKAMWQAHPAHRASQDTCPLAPDVTLALVGCHFLDHWRFSCHLSGLQGGPAPPHPRVHNLGLKVGPEVMKSGPSSSLHMQQGQAKASRPHRAPLTGQGPSTVTGLVNNPKQRPSSLMLYPKTCGHTARRGSQLSLYMLRAHS